MQVPHITLRCLNQEATISLFGGHLLSYTVAQKSLLFLSQKAALDGSRPIRGGTPVCWPWFGQLHPDISDHGIAHGLVRNQMWRVDAHIQTEVMSTVTLSPGNEQHALWPTGLSCQIQFTLTDCLTITLITTNRHSEHQSFSAALHSYFAVTDIAHAQITGITGSYHDHLTQQSGATPQPYHFAGETDRLHITTAPITQIIQDGIPSHEIEHHGHDSLVVWNPWMDKSAGFVDMAEGEYQRFVCIETATTQGHVLAPNQNHRLVQVIRGL
ncbi:MAG: D-hexose-6-phosphate mutarotase [Glaciecola sp.]|jgi:glucose-6-phosphate 1-epimerase